MSTNWKKHFEDEDDEMQLLPKIAKIRKEKRSVRGRVIDDWFVGPEQPDSDDVQAILADEKHSKYRLGRVMEVHKKHIFVAEEQTFNQPDTQAIWFCTVAKRHFQRAHKERNFVVVGDRVLIEPDANLELDLDGEPLNENLPKAVIQHSLHRLNKISRKDPMRKEWEHIMLANIDLIAIVASVLNPEVRWGLIDRIIVQAELDQIPVVIILNKVDLLTNTNLASPEFLAIYNRRIAIYRSIGYQVIEVSALHPSATKSAVIKLRRLFKNKLIGFCGHSGVGKSSILNLMNPEFEQIVDENPEIFYKGRHTTTYNSLIALGIGGFAIDTPGVRTFGIENIDAITLSACFKEFSAIKCKYRECSHHLEEDCGIKDAVAEGKISVERYRSYLGILKGVSFREGEGDSEDAEIIADMKARADYRDEILSQDIKDSDV